MDIFNKETKRTEELHCHISEENKIFLAETAFNTHKSMGKIVDEALDYVRNHQHKLNISKKKR